MFSALLSRFTSKTVVGRLLRVPFKLMGPQRQVSIVFGKLRGHKWIVGSANHGCWLGIYELEMQRLFAESVSEGAVVYDLGAHVGFYTLLASKAVGPLGKVVSFEPFPRNLRFLRQHLTLNEARNVDVIEGAVSATTSKICFKIGGSSTKGRVARDGELEVQVHALDDLYEAGRIPQPQFIKIDIEGAEADALMGAAGLLRRAHPTIFLATHGKDVHRKCCTLLSGFGYDLQAIGGGCLDSAQEILATHKQGQMC